MYQQYTMYAGCKYNLRIGDVSVSLWDPNCAVSYNINVAVVYIVEFNKLLHEC